jgi:hypothetical protein
MPRPHRRSESPRVCRSFIIDPGSIAGHPSGRHVPCSIWRSLRADCGEASANSILQAEALDPIGSLARLTTRAYGGNLGEYRRTHIAEVLDVLSRDPGQLAGALTPAEIENLEGRLELSPKLLGGLVGDELLPSVYSRALERRTENRGHNWELLRQTAEQNGLYFEPLPLDAAPDSFGIVWMARKDAEEPRRAFDNQFLHIANPFQGERVRSGTGYSQVWTLDRYGVRVPDRTEGGVRVEMIPLAVYTHD